MRILLLVALVGCTNSASAFDPDSVTTGFYNLTSTSTGDTCEPKRFVGDATVPLFAEPGGLNFADVTMVGSLEDVARHDITAATGYSLAIPANGERIDPCPPSQGSVEFNFAVTAASADHVEIDTYENWTVSPGCSATALVGASVVPQGSCTATRKLTYDLISACALPCQIRNNACSC